MRLGAQRTVTNSWAVLRVSRFRLTFTVDLIGDHEQPDDAAALEKAQELYGAFRGAMGHISKPGVLLPVGSVSPHPFPRPKGDE